MGVIYNCYICNHAIYLGVEKWLLTSIVGQNDLVRF